MLRDPHPAKIIHFCWYFKVNKVWLTNCVITDWPDLLCDYITDWLTDLHLTCSLWLHYWLNDWVTELHLYSVIALLTDWLTYTCTLWLHYWLSDWLTPVLCDCITDWVTDLHLFSVIALLTEWLTDWVTYWLTDLQLYSMIALLTDWLTYNCTLWLHYWLSDWLTPVLCAEYNWLSFVCMYVVTDLHLYSVMTLLTDQLTCICTLW